MTRLDVFDTIERLRAENRPFVVATVVRSVDVTSAKAGAKAVFTSEDGIIGHLGGGCVQRALKTAAMECLDTGETRLIRIKPVDDEDVAAEIDVHDSGCPSGGTIDLLIEAYRLPPRLVVIGDTPIAKAIMDIGAHLRFRMSICADVLEDIGRENIEPLNEEDMVIVASQGQGDRAALSAALGCGAGRVALIASRKKADFLRERLREDGILEDHIARIKAPAGLDIGGVDPPEIAVSILAEMIEWSRARIDI